MSTREILIVDDVEMNRAILGAAFEDKYRVLEAENGAQALNIIGEHKERIAAVLLDVIMPVKDGFAVLEEMNARGWISKIPVFLITADTSAEVMKKGYEMGAMDIINKPFVPAFIRKRVGNVIHLNNVLNDQEALLKQQEKEIRDLNRSVLETLSTAIEFRDCESGEHVVRISELTRMLLQFINVNFPEMAVPESEIPVIADAAVMHDVGKIAIPDNILNKPGRLTADEFEIMKTHTVRGCDLLDSIPKLKDNPMYSYAYDICRHHHERWDGKGYPDGLKGNEISIWAQVVSLADVYDALVSERVYKKAYSHEQAVEMIKTGQCGTFNPVLMECLDRISNEMAARYQK